jgi:hypothetical protein
LIVGIPNDDIVKEEEEPDNDRSLEKGNTNLDSNKVK